MDNAKEWYERNGIKEYIINLDPDKQLILTRDKPNGGIDSQEIKKIIDELVISIISFIKSILLKKVNINRSI